MDSDWSQNVLVVFVATGEAALGRGRGSFRVCSRLTGVLGPSFLLLGLALLICEMGMTHHQTSQLSLSHSFRQH